MNPKVSDIRKSRYLVNRDRPMKLMTAGLSGKQSVMAMHVSDMARVHYFLRMFLRILSFFPIATLFQGFSGLSAINKLLIAISCILLFFAFFFLSLSRMAWIQLIVSVGLTAVGIVFTQEKLVNPNMPMYLLFFVLLLVLVSERKDLLRIYLIKDITWYRNICICWCVIIIISIPFAMSYDKDGFFTSFTGNSFRTDPTALLILTYLILIVRHERRHRFLYFLMSLVPLYCGLMGASRTYFFIILLEYVIFLRCFVRNDKTFVACIIGAFIIMVPIVFVSNIGQRIIDTFYNAAEGYLGFWGTLTSGRSLFWAHDIQRFLELPLQNQMFGAGFNQIFLFNQEIGINIWAHNDFINIVITNGYIGLLSYLIAVYALFKAYWNSKGIYRCGFLVLMIIMWGFNAFFNMVYTYTCATIAMSILPLALGDGMTYKKPSMSRQNK